MACYGALRFANTTYYYWIDIPKNVGWVEQSETQQRLIIVGFRSSTQPTLIALLL